MATTNVIDDEISNKVMLIGFGFSYILLDNGEIEV